MFRKRNSKRGSVSWTQCFRFWNLRSIWSTSSRNQIVFSIWFGNTKSDNILSKSESQKLFWCKILQVRKLLGQKPTLCNNFISQSDRLWIFQLKNWHVVNFSFQNLNFLIIKILMWPSCYSYFPILILTVFRDLVFMCVENFPSS